MNIMVIGGGGREHAIIRKIRENPGVKTVWALPGNGGIAADAECVGIKATDLAGIVEFAKNHPVDYAVVAPDDPLVLGCVDELEAIGIPCFGPRKNAAIIEGSKVFAKNLMKKYGIPTAAYAVFDDAEKAMAYLENAPMPAVIKADGLALGKGVLIAMTREEAFAAVREIMEEKKFGASGNQIVIEEFLEGPEVSVLSFTDGETVVPMVSSMDHKRAGDGDTGLNTGGMGTVAPNPYYTEQVAAECMEKIFLPTIRAMKQEGRELGELIADLKEPKESVELRLTIDDEDFHAAGRAAIEKVMDHAAFAPGWHIAPDNREGVRINFDLEDGLMNGWFLLRLSVHDPVLPLNIESDVEGGVHEMASALLGVLSGAEGVNLSRLEEFVQA